MRPQTRLREAALTVSAFIGLGANLDDPRARLLRVFDELAGLPDSRLVARSSLWRSAPIGYADQPEFINAVAQIETGLSAGTLLGELHTLESAHGRERSFPNAPRTLDLDLLLYDEEEHASPTLSVPHPRMHERAFVLQPLLEIAPAVTIPGHGPARACLAALDAQACERIS
jgi:2-amino-4-hydroxy-6-hydroxymethyldihydropteridine diphosphokinase